MGPRKTNNPAHRGWLTRSNQVATTIEATTSRCHLCPALPSGTTTELIFPWFTCFPTSNPCPASLPLLVSVSFLSLSLDKLTFAEVLNVGVVH